MFASLFGDDANMKAFHDGLRSNPFTDGAEACASLSVDAYRCAELQGFQNPLCLARKMRHTRCVARFFAPEFLERLETCELKANENCDVFVADLNQVVSKRLNAHVDDIKFSQDERKAAAHCGLAMQARSQAEYQARLECVAPFVCAENLRQLEKCYDATNSTRGMCAKRSQELMKCLGQASARTYFTHP